MHNRWVAQPGVSLFDRERGSFNTRAQGGCKPYYPKIRASSGQPEADVTLRPTTVNTSKRATEYGTNCGGG